MLVQNKRSILKICSDLGKLQNCVVEELEKCKDSTPANIIDALFRFIKRSACSNKNKRSVYARKLKFFVFTRKLKPPIYIVLQTVFSKEAQLLLTIFIT